MRKKQNETLAEAIPEKYQHVFESVFMGIIPSVSSFEKPIKDPEIRALLLNFGVPRSYTYGVVIRSYVNDLRRKCILPICSSPKGYWVAKRKIEIEGCIDTLNHRVFGIQAAIAGLEELKKSLSA